MWQLKLSWDVLALYMWSQLTYPALWVGSQDPVLWTTCSIYLLTQSLILQGIWVLKSSVWANPSLTETRWVWSHLHMWLCQLVAVTANVDWHVCMNEFGFDTTEGTFVSPQAPHFSTDPFLLFKWQNIHWYNHMSVPALYHISSKLLILGLTSLNCKVHPDFFFLLTQRPWCVCHTVTEINWTASARSWPQIISSAAGKQMIRIQIWGLCVSGKSLHSN